MQCNCIEEIEARVKEHVQPKIKVPIEAVKCQNISWVFGNGAGTYISIPFGVKADATGYRSEKGKQFMVHASYCPFCGKPTKPKSEATGPQS